METDEAALGARAHDDHGADGGAEGGDRVDKNSVITMLSRLEQKQAVRYEEGARARRYYPCLNREDASRQETESFLDKVYGGRLGLMMSAMVESHALTEADIEELSEILRKAGGKK